MARVEKALTEREVRALTKKVGCHAVGGAVGLSLRVRATKAGTSCKWCLRTERQGKETKITLGSYPEMGLHDARTKAIQLRGDLARGVNPIAEAKQKAKKDKEQKQLDALKALTVGDLLGEWLEYKASKGYWGKGNREQAETTRRTEERRIRNNLPSLLNVSVASCEPEDVANAIAPIWCEKHSTCDKICAHLHGFFHWAMVKKYRPRGVNPADTEWLKALLATDSQRTKKTHRPALAPDQIPHLVKALVDVGSTRALCTLFSILTCSRSKNAREIRWDQLSSDWQLWTIDAKDMKVTANGQHKIPLTDEMRAILAHRKRMNLSPNSPYVFASDKLTGKPIASSSMNDLIKRSHALEVEAGREGWLDRTQTEERGEPVVAVQHAISRSTFETWAHETRQDERAVQLILHHEIDPRLKSAYDRSEDLTYKRKVLEAWSKHCFSLCDLDNLTK